jgi:spermidine synthase
VLFLVFALSGAAALIFETLFFRLAGLALGNGVTAAAIVLASFMAGLGLGNALAARLLRRVARPLRVVAALELGVALYGAGLVACFPALSAGLAPLLRSAADSGAGLVALRLALAAALFTPPAVAMGMTLPVLVGALSAADANFGRVLGRLYGWNTLGAVAGALLAERVLVAWLGLVGAGLSAAALDGIAATGALWLRRRGLPDALRAADRRGDARRLDAAQRRLLAAAFLSGGILLALEVVWFRFFLLFTPALAWNLALMLAVVLGSIGTGGLLGSLWFERRADAQRHAGAVAAAAGIAVVGLYAGLAAVWPHLPDLPLVYVFVWLMAPVSLASGLLFPLLGRALEQSGLAPTIATGRLALANTAGSALGSLLGGLLGIPLLGIERCLFSLAALYAGVAWLAAPAGGPFGRRRIPLAAISAAAALPFFPFGALEARILAMPGGIRAVLEADGNELVAFEESLTETLQYFRKPLLGETHYHTLVTNNHPMAGTSLANRRYMKAYVYWPMALNPDARNALLISYGVGGTASALVATPELETIDVVDISRAILEASSLVYPPERHPLADPRVRVHLEDGRFFLLAGNRRFDLVTGEPPPPRHAGVGNLYSREYFELVRQRLRDGGVVSYWLSVHQLRLRETKAVLAGFCQVFPECSLWSGNGLEWMMVAVKQPRGAPSARDFARQWRQPAITGELSALGFGSPASLGPTFIADAERLRAWIGDVPPLVDAFPQRIASRPVELGVEHLREYHRFMSDPEAERRFFESESLARWWPASWRRPDPAHTRLRSLLMRDLWQRPAYQNLARTLREPELRAFAPWVVGSDADGVAIARVALARDPTLASTALPASVHAHLVAAALADGDAERVDRAFARWEDALGDHREQRDRVGALRIAALLAAQRAPQALVLLDALRARSEDDPPARERVGQLARWAYETFGPGSVPPSPPQ